MHVYLTREDWNVIAACSHHTYHYINIIYHKAVDSPLRKSYDVNPPTLRKNHHVTDFFKWALISRFIF